MLSSSTSLKTKMAAMIVQKMKQSLKAIKNLLFSAESKNPVCKSTIYFASLYSKKISQHLSFLINMLATIHPQ